MNRLLAQALEIEEADRVTWLSTLEPAHRDLLPLLERLLAQAGATRAVETAEIMPRLRSDAFHGSSSAASARRRDEQPGHRIGPYRLVREAGHGGMGTVWLAERDDGAYQRQVALKLPRAEWTDRGLAERMERERSVLASLNHPNIAQMYDAGWAGDGRPYLALEYVEGEPIDAWCGERKLDVRARLRLFVDVVRAVAFAHTKLVIHRDLKPGNVLVTGEGRVKLLDFGIAKLLLADTTLAEETALTCLSGRALTLNYAAPEQILGEPISTAADTYSLGVMLFELLTGERPYRLARDSRGALEEAIVSVEPPAPSSVATDKAVARALRGDLDAIILKALGKQPEQRYETAAAFADDLERWLDQRPVRAQRSSGWYRTRRFLARHRLVVATATIATCALLAGGGLALWQYRAAGEEAARADSVRDFVLSIIAQADPTTGGETREADLTLLTTAEARLANELAGRPALALEMRLAIAKAYRNRGEFVRARATLRSAIDAAQQALPADDPQLARAWIEIADWQILASDEVAPALARAIATARQMGEPGVALLIDGLHARLYRRWGWEGRRTEAHADVREAHALAVKHLGAGHPTTIIATWRLACCGDGSPEERGKLSMQAYEAARVHPAFGPSHPRLLEIQATHAIFAIAAGRTSEGLELLHAAVNTARQHHGSGLPTQRALSFLADGLRMVGDVGGAYKAARDAHELAAAREPMGSFNRSVTALEVMIKGAIARRWELAPAMLEEYMANIPALTGEGNSDRHRHWIEADRVWLMLHAGDTNGAARLAQQAIESATRHGWPEKVGLARLGWGAALRQNGKFEEADRVLSENRPAGKEHAAVKLALGDAKQALTIVDAALKRMSVYQRQIVPFTADHYVVRGQALLQLGRPDEAREAFRIADEYWRGYDADSPYAAEAQYWHGQSLIANGDAVRGREWVQQARPRLATSHLRTHRALAELDTKPR